MRKFILLIVSLAIACQVWGSGVATASPAGGGCSPEVKEAKFARIGGERQLVSYALLYHPAFCYSASSVACLVTPDEQPYYPGISYEYSITLWWEYGTAGQIQLDTQDAFIPQEALGGSGEISIVGTFPVPSGTWDDTPDLTFVINLTKRLYCGPTLEEVNTAEPVLATFPLSVRGEAYQEDTAFPGSSGTQSETAATTTPPERMPTTEQFPAAGRLPVTGSSMTPAPILIAGGSMLLLSLRRKGRR